MRSYRLKLMLGNDDRVSANLSLKAANGMGIRIYSNDENEEALQDLTVSMAMEKKVKKYTY